MVESVPRRYGFKLIGGVTTAGLEFFIQSLLARTLGPAGFGQFTFIQSHLLSILGCLELGGSTAFFTKLSQRPERYQLLAPLILVFVGALSALSLSYVFLVPFFQLESILWPEIRFKHMQLGLLMCLGIFLARRTIQLSDAAAVSSRVEPIRVGRALLVSIVILLFTKFNNLTLSVALFSIGTGYLLQVIFNLFIVHRAFHHFSKTETDSRNEVGKELVQYAAPLAAYTFLSVGFNLFERWLLQYTGGSVAQGHLGIGIVIAAGIYLVTGGPLVSIFHRESANLFQKGEKSEMALLWRNYLQKITALTAFICIFLALNAPDMILAFLGEEYHSAKIVMVLFLLYPIHQVSGSLNEALMMACNRTRLYMLIGSFRGMLGLLLAYWLLAPSEWFIPGLSLGAIGLTIKFLLTQELNTWLIYFINIKTLKLSNINQLGFELKLFSLLVALAFLCQYFSQFFYNTASINALITQGACYLTLCTSALYIRPTIFGFTREELTSLTRKTALIFSRLFI